MKKSLFIFAHRGYVGAVSDIKDGIFLNKPLSLQEMGISVDYKHVCITKDALDILLSKATHSHKAVSPLMLHEGGLTLLGTFFHAMPLRDLFSRECDKGLLDKIDIIVKPSPKVFCDKIDSMLGSF